MADYVISSEYELIIIRNIIRQQLYNSYQYKIQKGEMKMDKKKIYRYQKYTMIMCMLGFIITLANIVEGLKITRGQGTYYENAKNMVMEVLNNKDNIKSIDIELATRMCGQLIIILGFIMGLHMVICLIHGYITIKKEYDKKKFKMDILLKMILGITNIFYYSSILVDMPSLFNLLKLIPFLILMLFVYIQHRETKS